MLTHKIEVKSKKGKGKSVDTGLVFAFLLFTFYFFTSCGSKPTDLRSVIPADSLVYLESNDLGAVMNAITERPAFREAAQEVPDLSVLNGVKLAVAVTGFETKEQPVTEENSVLNFIPRFVAVLETNAWNYQAIKFTEERLGSFIDDVYGGEVLLETSDKHDGRYFVWTANDGRKAYGLVQGSVVYFGNDESAIEKCLAVKRGETESISKNPKITNGERLAFGYVSADGIDQIANIVGLSLAKQSSEEGEVQSFVARVLPKILRSSLRDGTWTATRGERGIEDKFVLSTEPGIASVLDETLAPADDNIDKFKAFLQFQPVSTTRYSLRDPRIAWRSVLLAAQHQTDPTSGSLIAVFADNLFEPYAIEDSERFLDSIGTQIVTVRYDAEGEKQVVIADVKKLDDLKRSVAKELGTSRTPTRQGNADIWKSEDGRDALIIVDGKMILGDAESALRCLEMYSRGEDTKMTMSLDPLVGSNAVAVTIGSVPATAVDIVKVISEGKDTGERLNESYLTETKIGQKVIERRTVSNFGFIGSIITQLGTDQ